MSATPKEFLDFVDNNTDAFIKRLSEAVSIKSWVIPSISLEIIHLRSDSVSGDAAYRSEVFKMSDWISQQFKAVGVETQQVDLGKHIMDGQELQLPKAVLGRLGNNPNKKTILVYGHFDVQPVLTNYFQNHS